MCDRLSAAEPRANSEVLAYLEALPPRPPAWEPPLVARRAESKAEVAAESGVPTPVSFVEDVRLGEFGVRVYLPTGEEQDALVWMHGGGWAFHDVDAFDPLARALASSAGCAVVSVDYRLAPEHPYPAGLEDCWSATRWCAERFDKIAVGGDSSGGNLATVVAIRSRDAKLALALQLLVYPVTDYAVESDAYEAFSERYQCFAGIEGFGARSKDGLAWIWDQYVPDHERRSEPEASPLRARSFAGAAPAIVILAEHDILMHENEEYVRRLREDGVPVEVAIYEGQTHGFFHRLGVMEDARRAVSDAGSALRAAFTAQ